MPPEIIKYLDASIALLKNESTLAQSKFDHLADGSEGVVA
jgi:hypothetical protein